LAVFSAGSAFSEASSTVVPERPAKMRVWAMRMFLVDAVMLRVD
jgi:hypothetical protein